MSWRRVGAIYLILALLAGYVLLFERSPRESEQPGAAPTVEASLLQTDAASVTGLTLRRDGKEIRAVDDGGRWRVVEPVGVDVPPDLVAALVATVTAGQASEVMLETTGADLADFGLAAPRSEMVLTTQGPHAETVHVLLGAANPTRTAIYARRQDRPEVFLVGLNVRYYTDLIFEAAEVRG